MLTEAYATMSTMSKIGNPTGMKETVRLRAKHSSWRGSCGDMRSDIEFAEELVRRRAPNDDIDTAYSVDLEGSLDDGRTRKYSNLDDLIVGVAELDVSPKTIEASVSNQVLSLTLTLQPADGVEVIVRGNAVDAEGVRSEIKRHLSHRETLPVEVLWLGVGIVGVTGAFAFWMSLERWASFEEPSKFARTAFPIAVGAFALAVAARILLGRTFPRLELVTDGDSQSRKLKKRLGTAAGYIATAVLGAVAAHYLS
jgi:hypothetical protein